MNIQEILSESSRKAARRYLFLHWIVPTILFLLTVVSTLYAGSLVSGEEHLSIPSLFKGLSFSVAMILIMSSHAFGHYLTARFHGVDAYLPYFIPTIGIDGTAGAYTKMKWPISDRNFLMRIFTVGPIVGFFTSWLILMIGLGMSQVIEMKTIQNSLTLEDSLITFLSERLVLGQIPDNKDLLLHPVAYAGWVGLWYNCWHLLPIGKLDGGRILYALQGYKVTKWTSYSAIIFLVLLNFISSGWLPMALLGVFCTINFRAQYPAEKYTDEIQKGQIYLSFIAIIIFIISLPIIHFR